MADEINLRYFDIKKVENETFATHIIVVEEVSVRTRVDRSEVVDEELYKIDQVIFVKPRIDSLKTRTTYTIGIEIKAEYSDMMTDSKMQYYLGHTDFFFLAVPYELCDAAIRKVATLAEQYSSSDGRVGVLNIDNCIVVKWPSQQQVSLNNRFRLTESALWGLGRGLVQVCKADQEILAGADQEDNEDTTIIKQAEERLQIRNANMARSRKAREEQYKETAKRAAQLLPSVRDQLGAMLPAANVVFWAVRDAMEQGGVNTKDIMAQTQQSESCVTRAIKKLRESGMIKLDGAKKTGKFVVVGDAAKESRCLSCLHYNDCQGNSLMCGSYQPFSEDDAEVLQPEIFNPSISEGLKEE